MRIGIVIPTFDQFASASAFSKLAEEIEALGFDSAWFGDHIVFPADRPEYLGSSWFEPFACALQGLGMTTRLKFGTDVLVAPYRNPLMLAKMAVTAAELSGGRLMLGLGIGWLEGEFDALGAPPFSARAQVTDEYLKVFRMMFEQDGPLSFEGRWIRFEDVLFEPKPSAAPPLIVGGNNANALRRAALLGDGWHPLFLGPGEYARCRAEIEQIRAEAGITRPFIFSLSGPQARILPDGGRVAQSRLSQEGTSYAPPPGTDEEGRLQFTGTADQVREDCLAMAKAGVDQLVLRFAVPLDRTIDLDRHVEQLRLLADVLPDCERA